MNDKDILKRKRDIETRKIHQCAEHLKSIGYFTSEILYATLREYGVAYGYFVQLYHLDWKYEWVKKYTMTFDEFIDNIVFQAKWNSSFGEEKLNKEYYSKQYRLNGSNVEKYEQEYMYCIAFRKKDSLNI